MLFLMRGALTRLVESNFLMPLTPPVQCSTKCKRLSHLKDGIAVAFFATSS